MYFLARYGRMQALYYALGRGKLLNEQVIDVSTLRLPRPPMLSPLRLSFHFRGVLSWRHDVV